MPAEWRERVQATTSPARVLSLVDHLFEQPILAVPEAAEVMDMTRAGAHKNVRKLEEAGILREVEFAGVTRLKFYGAPDILKALSIR